jgi:hypothetical protein
MKSTAFVEMTSRLSSMAVPTRSPMKDRELVIASRLFWMPKADLLSLWKGGACKLADLWVCT